MVVEDDELAGALQHSHLSRLPKLHLPGRIFPPTPVRCGSAAPLNCAWVSAGQKYLPSRTRGGATQDSREQHPIPTSTSRCWSGKKYEFRCSKKTPKKVKFYFLFPWSLIADQSWPFRLVPPASSCSWAAFQGEGCPSQPPPRSSPPACSYQRQGQSMPLTLPSSCCGNRGAGNEIRGFSGFARPPRK